MAAVLVAGVVVEHERRFLLVREGTGSVKGKWNLPAGRVEPGESLAAAAAREAEEETGYRVEVLRPLGVYEEPASGKVQNAFLARIAGGALRVPEDMLDVRWFGREEIARLELRNEWVTRAIDAAKG